MFTAYLSQQCGLNTLYASSCEGYAVAYLAQQCGLNDLYDSACPNYGTAYRIQQCDEDAQYSPTCNGYVQDTVARNMSQIVTSDGDDYFEVYAWMNTSGGGANEIQKKSFFSGFKLIGV